MNTYQINYTITAKGKLLLEVDSVAQAKEIFKSFQEFELYDDSDTAKVSINRIAERSAF